MSDHILLNIGSVTANTDGLMRDIEKHLQQ